MPPEKKYPKMSRETLKKLQKLADADDITIDEVIEREGLDPATGLHHRTKEKQEELINKSIWQGR